MTGRRTVVLDRLSGLETKLNRFRGSLDFLPENVRLRVVALLEEEKALRAELEGLPPDVPASSQAEHNEPVPGVAATPRDLPEKVAPRGVAPTAPTGRQAVEEAEPEPVTVNVEPGERPPSSEPPQMAQASRPVDDAPMPRLAAEEMFGPNFVPPSSEPPTTTPASGPVDEPMPRLTTETEKMSGLVVESESEPHQLSDLPDAGRATLRARGLARVNAGAVKGPARKAYELFRARLEQVKAVRRRLDAGAMRDSVERQEHLLWGEYCRAFRDVYHAVEDLRGQPEGDLFIATLGDDDQREMRLIDAEAKAGDVLLDATEAPTEPADGDPCAEPPRDIAAGHGERGSAGASTGGDAPGKTTAIGAEAFADDRIGTHFRRSKVVVTRVASRTVWRKIPVPTVTVLPVPDDMRDVSLLRGLKGGVLAYGPFGLAGGAPVEDKEVIELRRQIRDLVPRHSDVKVRFAEIVPRGEATLYCDALLYGGTILVAFVLFNTAGKAWRYDGAEDVFTADELAVPGYLARACQFVQALQKQRRYSKTTAASFITVFYGGGSVEVASQNEFPGLTRTWARGTIFGAPNVSGRLRALEEVVGVSIAQMRAGTSEERPASP